MQTEMIIIHNLSQKYTNSRVYQQITINVDRLYAGISVTM